MAISGAAISRAETAMPQSRGSGGLVINSNLDDSGVVWANGGNVSFNGAVTGSDVMRMQWEMLR